MAKINEKKFFFKRFLKKLKKMIKSFIQKIGLQFGEFDY